ncbi:chromatin remodeling regulator CECR2-like [Acipenser ruthenus]|uniref:chromatin remodeling regulator CECR2-like n=1 Tax=Acipenser ruthenus TaxID=7906 RepID=UPI0027410BB9|nr:chromatin remodeling regulator CECR2-like [Acipenser ruthenus]
MPEVIRNDNVSEEHHLITAEKETEIQERNQAREARAKRQQSREERALLMSRGIVKITPPDKQEEKNEHKISRQYLDDEEYTSMFKVLEAVKIHKDSWPFCDPVDEHDAPDYYNQIQTPMDLTTIEDKLIKNRYKTTEDFVADFSLIIKNCVEYNGKGNEYSLMARTLEQCFHKAMRKYFPEEKSESDEEEFTLEGKKEKRKRLSSHYGKMAAEHFMTPLNNFDCSSGGSQLLTKQAPGTVWYSSGVTGCRTQQQARMGSDSFELKLW